MKWSYSKLSTFERCPEMFYRKYIIFEKTVENQRKYLEGSILQSLFEGYVNTANYRSNNKDWLLQHLDWYYENYLEKQIFKKQPILFKDGETKEKIVSKLTKYIKNTENFFRHRGFDVLNLESEVSFNPAISMNKDVELQGSIDFLIRHPDKSFDIMDLKTTSSKKYIQKDQLLFYTLQMYLKEDKLPNEAYFFNAAKNEIISVPIKMADLQDLVNRLKKYTKIVKTDFRRMYNLGECWGCAFAENCVEERLEGVIKDGRGSF